MNDWFVVRSSGEAGPFTSQQLKTMAADGRLGPDDQIRRQDQKSSVEARKVRGLFAESNGAKPAESNPPQPSEPTLPKTAATPPASALRPKSIVLILAAAFGGFFVVCCGGTGILVSIASVQREKIAVQLPEADKLWDSGNRADAAAKYTAMLNNPLQSASLQEHRGRVFGRVIDVALENGNEAEGRKWIEMAFKLNVAPQITTDKASMLIEEIIVAEEARREVDELERKADRNEPQEKPENTPTPFSFLGSGGRKLTVQVGNNSTRRSFRTDAYAGCLKNLRCSATSGELVIEFDVDIDRWDRVQPGSGIAEFDIFPLLIRLFDQNGNYLTHFESSEQFTSLEKAFTYRQQLRQDSPKRPQPILLKQNGNRLAYPVNVRDLEHAQIVEIGFLEIYN